MIDIRSRIKMAYRVLTGKSIAFNPIVDDWPDDDGVDWDPGYPENELPGMWEDADFIDNSEEKTNKD